MFNFRPPNTRPPGFRVGLPDDEELGFNVAGDGSAPPVLPGAPDVPTVDDNSPYGTTSLGFITPQGLSPYPAAPFGNGSLPPVLPGSADVPSVDDNYPYGTTPASFFAPQRLSPNPAVPFGNGSPPSVLPGTPDVPTIDGNYPYGTTPAGFFGRQGPSPNPAGPFGNGSPSPQAAGQMPPDPMASGGSMQPDPRGYGAPLNFARYVPENPINQTDPSAEPPNPVQKTSGGVLDVIGSAQAQTPQAQQPGTSLKRDPSPGEAVVLPNGLTIPSIDSTTGQVMSPVADLGTVAEKGRQAGATFLEMLKNPETAGVAAAYLYMTLAFRLGHGGTFDHQRRGNLITGFVHLPQFREISNINVGVFAQQAGLTLEQTLEAAGTLAKYRSNNYRPENPHGLDAETAAYIREGYNIAKTGIFGPAATP